MGERLACYGCDRFSDDGLCRACWRLVSLHNRREVNMAADEADTTEDRDLRQTALIRYRLAHRSAAAEARYHRRLGRRRAQEIRSWSEWRPLVLRLVGNGELDFGYA